MLQRHKTILRAVVGEMRRTLAGTMGASGEQQRGDLDRELERLGVAPDGRAIPLDALPNPTPEERQARYVADATLGAVEPAGKALARDGLVERAAYTWSNRLLALRVMEARGFIDETIRANPAYGGVSEALFVLRQTNPERCAGADGGWWAVVDDVCAALAATLPGLFDPKDPAAALRPSASALLRCVTLVGGAPNGATAEEVDATFVDPDTIGWTYQYYQEEAKARIDAKVKSGGKVVSRSEIAAKTELFTETYMVRWLLQNSLGRSYHQAYPDSRLPGSWEYYVPLPISESENVGAKLASPSPSSIRGLDDLTLMDPCMGSGHFLREAFDMLAAMYREQQPEMIASDIARRILSHHLYGIDIDPRCAQLAALTLYLRVRELERDDGRGSTLAGKNARPTGAGPAAYRPLAMNLATTPTGLTTGALERHLRRHPEDRFFQPLLKEIFAELEQADILGSLIQPGQGLDAAIASLRPGQDAQKSFLADELVLQRTLDELAAQDPERLKAQLLERVAASFTAEAGSADVAAALFGWEAERGVRLVKLLARRYAVVATNPPYMGSSNMDTPLRRFVEGRYTPGKGDLYATFILRCRDFCQPDGRVAMVTQQSWMFLRTFAALRALPESDVAEAGKRGRFTGVLRETSVETLAHMGEFAFEEAAGAFAAMFALANRPPGPEHRMAAYRLVGLRSAGEKENALRRAGANRASGIESRPRQVDLLSIPQTPFVYWLRPRFFELLRSPRRLNDIAEVKAGMQTGDNERFTRFFWEVERLGVVQDIKPQSGRWFCYAKGGRYQKWAGLEWLVVDWDYGAARLSEFPGAVLRNGAYYFRRGLSYTYLARGSMGVRTMQDSLFDVSGTSVFPSDSSCDYLELAAYMCSRLTSWILRVITQDLKFNPGYVIALPMADRQEPSLSKLGAACIRLKLSLVARDPVERMFEPPRESQNLNFIFCPDQAVIHSNEAALDRFVFDLQVLDEDDIQSVLDETGTPAGWHPLIAGYDALPKLPAYSSPMPAEVLTFVAALDRRLLSPGELAGLKARLRAMYEAGRGAKEAGDGDDTVGEGYASPLPAADDDGEALVGANIPIPPETFLEELSQKLEVHPISVYWLLEELRADGARCKPEERKQLEDRLGVLVLRLLGHRWPKQIEADEPVPDWADPDGIIPMTAGAGEAMLAERLRERLREEEGDLGAQRAEALLAELTGQSLEEWLRRTFFVWQTRRFKYRPIAWHLASVPETAGRSRQGGSRTPAFECLVYYHKCGTGNDTLARIRQVYIEPLLTTSRRDRDDARRRNDETTAAIAAGRIAELEAFAARLRQIENEGFGCPELEPIIAAADDRTRAAALPASSRMVTELCWDRWAGDGIRPPASREDFARQERAWQVDINDGVRVNIAPLQLAGVLVADVLKAADTRKALADRARWRSDERRWVREGVLPRCGWMPDSVRESTRWTERAGEREAERQKLEEKRRALAGGPQAEGKLL